MEDHIRHQRTAVLHNDTLCSFHVENVLLVLVRELYSSNLVTKLYPVTELHPTRQTSSIKLLYQFLSQFFHAVIVFHSLQFEMVWLLMYFDLSIRKYLSPFLSSSTIAIGCVHFELSDLFPNSSLEVLI